MGRAARNINGRVILYADRETKSMKEAIAETTRRRKIQAEYNKLHNITPRSATRADQIALGEQVDEAEVAAQALAGVEIPSDPREQQRLLESLKKEMFDAAARREFERAAELRDRIKAIQERLLKE
jgi:excinuclease ABC subunit B